MGNTIPKPPNQGVLYSWGISNNYGQLGHGDQRSAFDPKIVASFVAKGKSVKSVACNTNISFVITDDGALYFCGCAFGGLSGRGKGKFKCKSTFHKVEFFEDKPVAQIACGDHHVVALTESGKVFVWGYTSQGQLGIQGVVETHTPMELSTLPDADPVVQIACSPYATFVLTKLGRIYRCGYISHEGTRFTTPTVYGDITDRISRIDVCKSDSGSSGVAVPKFGNFVWTWGFGTNREANRIEIEHDSPVVGAAVTSACGYAWTEDGALFMFGRHLKRIQLGIPPNTDTWDNSLRGAVRVSALQDVPIRRVFPWEHGAFAETFSGDFYVWGSTFKDIAKNGTRADLARPLDHLPITRPTPVSNFPKGFLCDFSICQTHALMVQRPQNPTTSPSLSIQLKQNQRTLQKLCLSKLLFDFEVFSRIAQNLPSHLCEETIQILRMEGKPILRHLLAMRNGQISNLKLSNIDLLPAHVDGVVDNYYDFPIINCIAEALTELLHHHHSIQHLELHSVEMTKSNCLAAVHACGKSLLSLKVEYISQAELFDLIKRLPILRSLSIRRLHVATMKPVAVTVVGSCPFLEVFEVENCEFASVRVDNNERILQVVQNLLNSRTAMRESGKYTEQWWTQQLENFEGKNKKRKKPVVAAGGTSGTSKKQLGGLPKGTRNRREKGPSRTSADLDFSDNDSLGGGGGGGGSSSGFANEILQQRRSSFSLPAGETLPIHTTRHSSFDDLPRPRSITPPHDRRHSPPPLRLSAPRDRSPPHRMTEDLAATLGLANGDEEDEDLLLAIQLSLAEMETVAQREEESVQVAPQDGGAASGAEVSPNATDFL